ncbi:rap guanine nucleotide exchange factor 3-like, partial [Mustelus asterias]
GLVTTLHEEDDFGELALVNEAPRSATIVLGEDNCHFLRVDKQDFNRILRDVEANTVRLKEHGKDVLVMEKCSQTGQASGHGTSPAKYTVMYGTSEKILEYLLETINLDADYNDPSEIFLGDFILTHSVFMSISQLQNIIFKYYQAEPSGGSETERTTYSLVKKQKVVHLVTQWVALLGRQLLDVPAASRLLEELDAMVTGDSDLSYLAKDGVPDKRKPR